MSTLSTFGKGALRVAKNYTKGYSEVQAKVREATSNDPWGPSGTQMNELAQLTYNQNDFVEIMEMLDKRLNDKGKNWRHVFKALTVLDYTLHAGSENVVLYFKDNIYIIKTLKEFQYIDEEGKDQGANVRQKAKDITNLLMDDGRLRQERKSRAHMRDRMANGHGNNDGDDDDLAPRRSQSTPPTRSKRSNKDEDELKRAIEASKQSLAAENTRKAEEEDLQKALRLSQEDEAKRLKTLEDANSRALFDDQNQLNPFPLVDSSPQSQITAIQPQFTSFNPYTQQMQQQQLQEEYLRQQQEWALLEQQQQAQAQQRQQQEEWQRQQILLQQQQQQQEEWTRQQQALQFQQQQWQQQQLLHQQQQPLQPQHTAFGSKNPFAFSQSPATATPPLPLSSFKPPSPVLEQFSSEPPSPTAANTRANARRPFVEDSTHTQLASLLANRDDGIDTFGNFGQLRLGHQHGGQAPLIGQRTGSNPFQQSLQRSQTDNEQPFFTV
ncbi:uncharacterized protein EI90DRAFT_3118818 [Cantharellus anzutake]|uniref:uncharacterized protein n=1 Tax=Cantharellus anzutake TaxID=1750568 RepID=UPI0019039054|nr:uncharacterized protein EI90DRAFT_3118818 [Cantharellus anzutake]KAF8337376.1 hypothetical protein EI90DRAFT_3118818 [Cantharellus anzutake]